MHIRQKCNALNTEKKSTLFQYLNDKYNALKKNHRNIINNLCFVTNTRTYILKYTNQKKKYSKEGICFNFQSSWERSKVILK